MTTTVDDEWSPPDCPRCHQPAQGADRCKSPLYHPETWVDVETGLRVGNAAAAGELVPCSGEQYQWLVRRPRGAPKPAPAHLGRRHSDGVRFYDLDAVLAWLPTRPGSGGHGGPVSKRRRRLR